MTLYAFQVIWFLLIAVLWTGYLVLEGFDFGVGMLLPVLGRDDRERRVLINTIGPVWDGNEVWLLTAGGAMFAAFPLWYATVFSAFYLPLLLVLVGLIVRGVAFEWRGKIDDPGWRAWADRAIVVGSWLPAVLWGVAFGSILGGVQAQDVSSGPFAVLLGALNPYSLLTGATTALLFALHGAVFLALRTTQELRARAVRTASALAGPTLLVGGLWALWTQLAHGKAWTWAVVLVAAAGLASAVLATRAGREGRAFVSTTVVTVAAVVLIFGALFPLLLPVLGGTSLTVQNASSTQHTLTVMTWVAVALTPLVLAYQGWTYWVFRRRIGLSAIPAGTGLPRLPRVPGQRRQPALAGLPRPRADLGPSDDPGRSPEVDQPEQPEQPEQPGSPAVPVPAAGPDRMATTTTRAAGRARSSAGARSVRPLDPRLLRHARAARSYVALTAALGGVSTALVVTGALALARVVAQVSQGRATVATLGPELALLAVVAGLRAVTSWAQDRYGHRAATAVIGQLRQQVLDRLVRLGPAALDGDRGPASAVLLTRGLDALDGYLTRYLPQLLLAATLTPAVLLVIAVQDPLSAAVIALTLPLIPLFMVLVGLATAAQADRRLASMQRLGGQLLDLVAGLPTLRALGREHGQARRVQEVGEAYRRATMRTLRTAFLSAMVLEGLTTLSVALVAVGIGLRLVYGHLDLQTGLAVLVLAPEVFAPLRMVGVHYHASADGLAASGAAFETLALPVPERGRRPAPDLRTCRLRWRSVSVTRPGRSRMAPAGLDAEVGPGEVLALAGPNGAGKSTAVQVLLGLRAADRGALVVQPLDRRDQPELDLRELDPQTWWAQIAWVSQQPVLVPGTIADNVLAGAPPAARQALAVAAAATGLAEVVASLPQGWSTRVGNGGFGLSAGQRQRVALTRALVSDRQLLVLDEPTAHLDADSETAVHAAVLAARRAGRTVVLVAHRSSLLALADRVVQVRDAPAPAAPADGAACAWALR